MRLILGGALALTRGGAQGRRRKGVLLASRSMTLRRTALLGSNGSVLVTSVFVLGGCRSGVEIQRMPDGSSVLKCHAPLGKCIDAIDTLCKGNSYEILYARDDQRIYGSENESLIENRTSIAAVHCLGPHEKMRGADAAAAYSLPSGVDPKSDAAASEVMASRAAPNTAASNPGTAPSGANTPNGANTAQRTCVPGVTQACVGPGACNGGQACLADGSGFAPCDCGTGTNGGAAQNK